MEHCSIGIALHKKPITDGFYAVNYQDRIYLLLWLIVTGAPFGVKPLKP